MAQILIHGTFPSMRTVNDVVSILQVTFVEEISVLLFYSVELLREKGRRPYLLVIAVTHS